MNKVGGISRPRAFAANVLCRVKDNLLQFTREMVDCALRTMHDMAIVTIAFEIFQTVFVHLALLRSNQGVRVVSTFFCRFGH